MPGTGMQQGEVTYGLHVTSSSKDYIDRVRASLRQIDTTEHRTQESPIEIDSSASKTLGCGGSTSDPDKLLTCMRSKDLQDIRNAIPVSRGIASVTGLFDPTIDNITASAIMLQALLATRNFIPRPLVLGSNNHERGLPPNFRHENVTFTEAQWDYLYIVIYTCPTSYRAAASVSNNVPTWRYRYFGEFPNLLDARMQSRSG
ncbi:hypothetical protein TSTA_041920 [Talaromyces stipitatus ATCC 10500]|uniref:Carboxylesterase type B domain-containing protein n=1 Tax=Talaromyces stipitatus (strain ATCC 10500 / CBS 375.48 / QM 6759 / NRRL 1006) TaxID=441959 RepID=B8MJC8_TALSN|nr:uncharacterized protein TSTA_041920 [Talaromyces stipitatus ATCC 10500]EED14717.1 hypothetical protein TSTA_041920 [Talaromyces stipitatus ATCC 10500]